MIRLYAIIFIVALLGGAAYAAKYYYDTTQATIAQLRETLNKHDLTHLANKKPGLIEKRMQDATDKLWGDLESVTSDNTTD